MYQRRKFEFFEEKSGSGKGCSIPTEITAKVECCSSGRGQVVNGCDDGTVSFLDRAFKLIYIFQAHTSSVLFLQQLEDKNWRLPLNVVKKFSEMIQMREIEAAD